MPEPPEGPRKTVYYRRTQDAQPAMLEQQEWQAAEAARAAGWEIVSGIDAEDVKRIVHGGDEPDSFTTPDER